MKKVVPHSGKVAKEAREFVQECVKPQGGHSEENVLAIDCLPLLSLASLASLTKVKIIL